MATGNMLMRMGAWRTVVGHCRAFLRQLYCRPEGKLQNNDLDTMALGHMVVESDEEGNTTFPGFLSPPLACNVGHKGMARIAVGTWETEDTTGGRRMVALSHSEGILRNGMGMMHRCMRVNARHLVLGAHGKVLAAKRD
jgi:hypothetical protein